MLMNRKWIAAALGLAIAITGGAAVSANEMTQEKAEGLHRNQVVEVQADRAYTSQVNDADWESMLSDFQEIIALEEQGKIDEAKDLWEELIPQVDEKLGIFFEDAWMPEGEGEISGYEDMSGWAGYIGTFSGLIEDETAMNELMEFASDLDSLTEASPMVDKLESQISILLNEALGNVDLTEVEGIFADPADYEGYMSEVDLEQYGQLLELYIADEEAGDFEAAQDKYDEIIDLLNQYPELMQGGDGDLYAQFQVKDEKLTLIESPLDEYGQPMNVEEASKEDLKKYELLWEYVIRLMPDSATDFVDKFEVGSDGKDGTMAFVYPTNESGKTFVLNLDINDMIDSNGKYMKKDMDETIVHEFGHIITLNNTQMTDRQAGTYETQEGILTKESYLNKFHGEFWKGKTDKYLLSNEDGYREYDVEKLYGDHESWFVSDYAATNVEEDIAESFRVFVLEDKATGNAIKDEKINFFYQFPELVKMRDEIRDGK